MFISENRSIPLGEKSKITWLEEEYASGWLIGWRKDVKGLQGKIFIIKNTGQFEFIVNHPDFELYIYHITVFKWKKVLTYNPKVKIFELKNKNCVPIKHLTSVVLPQFEMKHKKLIFKPKIRTVQSKNKDISLKLYKLEPKIKNLWKM